jgi:quinol monooxygenase YgiN
MGLIDDRESGEFKHQVISVVKIRIEPHQAAGLLAKALDALAAESRKNLPGFLTGQVLLSVDNKVVALLSEWTDRHAWGKSRYDPIVESLIADFHDESLAIDFELYTRRGEVPIKNAKRSATTEFG